MDSRSRHRWFLLFLHFLWMFLGCEADGATDDEDNPSTVVFCRYNDDCVLPCNYKHGIANNIYWKYQTGGDFVVHVFDYNRDRFEDQDPRFKGRTSLVEDPNTETKTDLMLKNVKVQDEGIYLCLAMGDYHELKESSVRLQVDAPVQSVEVVREGNSATCSSEGVYPEPELSWWSSPQSSSTVQQSEEKLYSISSSLKLSDMDGDLLLSCTVSTRLNKWTSTLREPMVTSRNWAHISCLHTNTSFRESSLVWRFNHRETIMRWSSTDGQHISAQWKKHVEAEKDPDVLHLQDVSSHQEGTYSCELSRTDHTYATHTPLIIKGATKDDENEFGGGDVVGGVFGGVLIGVVGAVVSVVISWMCCRERCLSLVHWLRQRFRLEPLRVPVPPEEREMKRMNNAGEGDDE